MELLKEYLAKYKPHLELYSDVNSFMVFDIVDNILIIHQLYCRNIERLINVVRFLEFKQCKEYQYKINVNSPCAENDLKFYMSLGFKVYKADDNNIHIYVEFDEFFKACKSMETKSEAK